LLGVKQLKVLVVKLELLTRLLLFRLAWLYLFWYLLILECLLLRLFLGLLLLLKSSLSRLSSLLFRALWLRGGIACCGRLGLLILFSFLAALLLRLYFRALHYGRRLLGRLSFLCLRKLNHHLC
jgi:hypothetical protein